jgi:pimeloyl-ACP methyl ester carboxylesterase
MFATSFDGVPIHYDVAGLGSPALVFIHGWSCDRSYWERQMEAFQSNHLVVALDLAGHGDSGHERAVWSMEAFGKDVASVVEKLDLNEVVLIGHSMGGSVMLEAGRILTERVVALIAVDTFFDVETILSQEQTEQFLQPFRLDFRTTTRNYVTGFMFTPSTDASLKEAIATDMSLAPPEVATESLAHLVRYDTPSALQETDVPIHCINSDKYTTRVATARQYAPSFDVSVLPGASHFLMMENPEAFNRLLGQAIDKLVAGADVDPSDKGQHP